MTPTNEETIEVFLIEDNPGDVRLLKEAFKELRADINLKVARDGAEGVDLIERRMVTSKSGWPSLILLDLNLPKLSGHDVLARIKNNPETRHIPIIVLTSSRADADVRRAYESYANAYLRKPSTLEDLIVVAQQIKTFWLEHVTLPH